MSVYVSLELRLKVKRRAGDRCEYCLLREECVFLGHVPDHIIALKHGGKTVLSNLAWACAVCNGLKGSDLASMDWTTGRVARLFNPRKDRWSDHFQHTDHRILGRTPVGRATAMILGFNDDEQLSLRKNLMELGLYP